MTNRSMAEIIRNQTPVTMPPTASVQAACKAMHKRRIGAVLVADAKGKLTGIFTGRDAVRFLAAGKDPTATTLRTVMTRKPHTMPPGRTAIEALRLMRDGGFRHVPVVEEEVVVGIVSRGDFRGLEHDRLDIETGFWERIA
jgi:CBS domain-containing protein